MKCIDLPNGQVLIIDQRLVLSCIPESLEAPCFPDLYVDVDSEQFEEYIKNGTPRDMTPHEIAILERWNAQSEEEDRQQQEWADENWLMERAVHQMGRKQS